MNEAELLLWEMQHRRYRKQVELNEQLTRQLAEARKLLYRHQWGCAGHCPECAADMNHGHVSGCPWAASIAP